MKGQWIGSYTGSNSGWIVLNVDELSNCFEGTAYIHPGQKDLPKSQVVFRTKDKSTPFAFRTLSVSVLAPGTLEMTSWEKIKAGFPEGTAMSAYADVEGEFDKGSLSLRWKTDINLVGSCTLEASKAGTDSGLIGEEISWEEFKRRVGLLSHDHDFIYRGQSQPWRLRTAFHRHGRSDLRRFREIDIPMLHRHLSARTRHLFDLNDGRQNAAFLSLAQHHGYPTHLMDWTRSPYVAAFFAYRTVTNDDMQKRPSGRVRVFIFDSGQWRNYQSYFTVESPMLHMTMMEVLAVENERLIPQQSVSFICSVDDIESHIARYQTAEKKLLLALDLPLLERDAVLDELRRMGITAGSLFPGLDGTCEELKWLNFRFR
jgi:FRG domain